MLCEILGRFLPANGNHSLHGKFKDLDLGRVFHYSECCMEKCLCPIQGLRTMEWVLWRELNEAWGSGGFTPAVHPVLFKVFRLVTLYLRVLSFLLYFSLHPLQMFWSTLLLLFFVFAFLTFYQIKLAGQFRNPLLGCHHMRAGMYTTSLPPLVVDSFTPFLLLLFIYLLQNQILLTQLIMAAFQQVSEPLPTLSPSFFILLHLNNENPQQVRLENWLDL